MHKKMINEAMRIAGEKVKSEKTIDVEYPFTGEVIGTVPAGTAEHARKALILLQIINQNLQDMRDKRFFRQQQKFL